MGGEVACGWTLIIAGGGWEETTSPSFDMVALRYSIVFFYAFGAP